MTDAPIFPGLMGFTLPNMATIRFSGIVSPPTDAHAVFAALSHAGFGRLRIFDAPSALPDGWPQEDLPPLQAGESYLRGEGRWESTSDPIAHVSTSGGGGFSFFNVWVHQSYSGCPTPSPAPTPRSEPPSPGNSPPAEPYAQGGAKPASSDPPRVPSTDTPSPAPTRSVLTSPTAGADVGVAVGIGLAVVIGIAIAASRRASASRDRAERPIQIASDKQLAGARRYVSGLRQSARGA